MNSPRTLRGKIPLKLLLYFIGTSVLLAFATSFIITFRHANFLDYFITVFSGLLISYVFVFLMGRFILLMPYRQLVASEKRTAESREKLIAVLNSIVDAIITTDEDGFIQEVNPAALQIFGYTESELIGQRVTMLTPDEPTVVNKSIDTQIRELTGIRKNGERFPIELGLSSVIFEDRIIFVGIVRDISERKLADAAMINYTHNMEEMNKELSSAKKEAESAARIKSEFIASMSHEIRTPMNGIVGMTEILMDSHLNATQYRYATSIMHCTESLLAIINDVLDFSKIEAGKLTLEAIEFNLLELCEELVEMLSINCYDKGIEIFLDYQTGLPNLVIGDPTRVRQVMLNLLTNAIKFTDKGYVIMRVTQIGEIKNDKTQINVSVEDTGIGIEESAKQQIFAKFTQADASITRKFGGTGLGLTICRQLAEKMHGEIGFDSEFGKGSTFWFTLELPIVNPSLATKQKLVDVSNYKAAIVIASPMCSQMLRNILDSFGLITSVHQKIPTVITSYDVILLDYDLRADITDTNLLTKSAFILTFPFPISLDEQKFLEIGYRGFLTIPFRKHLVLEQIVRAISPTKDAAKPLTEPETDHANLAGKKVLMVEDNRVNAEIGETLLRKLGLDVTIANNGIEAIDIYYDNNFDLVFMDIQMPGMSGYEVTHRLREIEQTKNTKHTPIVALTANVIIDSRDKCLQAGMDDFLIKPYRKAEIIKLLNKWLTV